LSNFEIKESILSKYFCEISNIPIAILDKNLNIIQLNKAFHSIVNIDKSLNNIHISHILNIDTIYEESTIADLRVSKMICEINSANGSTTNFHGVMIKNQDIVFVIFENYLISESSIVSHIAEVNVQMSDMSREISKKNHELERANREITKLLNTDYLTGIYNRRFFFEKLNETIEFKKKSSYPDIGLILADIDFFKKFNDTYGHDVGDLVLKEFSRTMNESLPEGDIIARVGGEEFCFIVKCESMEYLKKIAEKLRESCESIKITNLKANITASFGATIYKNSDTIDSFMKRVDLGLYEAKENGRNQVVFV